MADCRFHLGEEHLHDLPDTRQADPEIVVDQDVTEAGDSPPIDLRPGSLQRLGESLAGLSQRLEVRKTASWVLRSAKNASFPSATYSSIRPRLSLMWSR